MRGRGGGGDSPSNGQNIGRDILDLDNFCLELSVFSKNVFTFHLHIVHRN